MTVALQSGVTHALTRKIWFLIPLIASGLCRIVRFTITAQPRLSANQL